ncbi:MAG: hypothetical protein LLG06_11645 [Desulfobacteraceae bacterium]|nr:hypothetical protein [Desulfobacteraceae bacterium]
MSESVRQLAASNTFITKKQAREVLGLTVDQSVSAFENLVRWGWLIREEHGIYRFNEQKAQAREASVEDRIWRLCRMIKPSFSVAELASQGGTTANYVYRLLRTYRADGFVAQAGRRAALTGSMEKLWRLTPKGRSQRDRPILPEWTPDPQIAMAVKLNRLICTGMVVRFEDARAEAIKLCGEIARALGGMDESTEAEAAAEGKGEKGDG